jgi:hypothetical protein
MGVLVREEFAAIERDLAARDEGRQVNVGVPTSRAIRSSATPSQASAPSMRAKPDVSTPSPIAPRRSTGVHT